MWEERFELLELELRYGWCCIWTTGLEYGHILERLCHLLLEGGTSEYVGLASAKRRKKVQM